MRALIVLASLSCILVFNIAQAHTRSQSFSSWSPVDNGLAFSFTVDTRRVTQLSPLYEEIEDIDQLLETHLRESLVVELENERCALTALKTMGHSQRRVSGEFFCGRPAKVQDVVIHINSFFAVSPTHIHIAKFQTNDIAESSTNEYVLREDHNSFQLTVEHPVSGLVGFIKAGFTHVLSGLDHIAFLIALTLIANRLGLALLCITGFTLGHSITLALATFSILKPNTHLIEALIGFTIALTALEAAAQFRLDRRLALTTLAVFTLLLSFIPATQLPLPLAGSLALLSFTLARMSIQTMVHLLPLLTIAFGLIHGAGFAGGLNQANITRDEIIAPLIGFNVGVELAQLLVLSMCYFLFAVIRRIETTRELVPQFVNLLVFSLGCFWFAERIM